MKNIKQTGHPGELPHIPRQPGNDELIALFLRVTRESQQQRQADTAGSLNRTAINRDTRALGLTNQCLALPSQSRAGLVVKHAGQAKLTASA